MSSRQRIATTILALTLLGLSAGSTALADHRKLAKTKTEKSAAIGYGCRILHNHRLSFPPWHEWRWVEEGSTFRGTKPPVSDKGRYPWPVTDGARRQPCPLQVKDVSFGLSFGAPFVEDGANRSLSSYHNRISSRKYPGWPGRFEQAPPAR